MIINKSFVYSVYMCCSDGMLTQKLMLTETESFLVNSPQHVHLKLHATFHMYEKQTKLAKWAWLSADSRNC